MSETPQDFSSYMLLLIKVEDKMRKVADLVRYQNFRCLEFQMFRCVIELSYDVTSMKPVSTEGCPHDTPLVDLQGRSPGVCDDWSRDQHVYGDP